MKESKLATILALAALDDSEIKSLEQRVNELAELGFKPEIVEELPEEGNDHTLYLVPQNDPGEDPWYKEYLWLDNEWENIGTTSINFDNYELLSNKVTELTDESTDTQYPSAKAVYDMIANIDMDSIPIIDEVKFHEIQEHQYPQWTERQMSTYLIYAECGPGVYQMKLNSGWDLFHSVNNGLKYMSKECLAIIQKRCGIYIWDYADRQAATGEPRITVYYYNGTAEPTTTTYYASLNEDVSLSSLIHLPWFEYDVQKVFYQALGTSPWHANTSYNEGDLVVYVNIAGYPYHIYEANTTVPATSSWNSQYWNEISFAQYFPKALKKLGIGQRETVIIEANIDDNYDDYAHYLISSQNVNMLLNKCAANEPFDLFVRFVNNSYWPDGILVPAWIEQWENSGFDHDYVISAHAFGDGWTTEDGFYWGLLNANEDCAFVILNRKTEILNYQSTDSEYPTARAVVSYVETQVDNSRTQYNSMPIPSSARVNQIIQYTGTTTQNYTNGYFYKCINNGSTYKWEQFDIQPDSQTEVIIVQADINNNFQDYTHYDISVQDVNMLLNKLHAGEHFEVFIRFVSDPDYYPDGVLVPAWIEEWDTSAFEGYALAARPYESEITQDGYYSCLLYENKAGDLNVHAYRVSTFEDHINDYNYPTTQAVETYVNTEITEQGYVTEVLRGFQQLQPLIFSDLKKGYYWANGSNSDKKFYYKVSPNTNTQQYSLGTASGLLILKTQDAVFDGNTVFGYIYYMDSEGWECCRSLRYIFTNGVKTGVNFENGFILGKKSVSDTNQIWNGIKTFASLPKINSYTAPTTDTQFTPKKYVDDKIAVAVSGMLKRVIVEALPIQDIDPNTIYMILKIDPELHNVYDEWMYINNEWELIGTTEVDLTNYLAKDNTTVYTPNGQYNPSTKGYVDNYFFKGSEMNWDLLTPTQQAAYAVAIVTCGVYELTPDDISNLDSTLGSDEPIVSDMTEDEGIALTNQIIGGNE